MTIEQFVLENLPKLSPDGQKEVFDRVINLCRKELPRHKQPGLGIKELLQDKREDILAVATRHRAFNVRVFGSVARGEADEYSDIGFWCC